MKKSTFSILFVAQKGKLKSNGKAPILARVTVKGDMFHMATRLEVAPERWIGKEGRTLGKNTEDKYIDQMLDNYRNAISNKYNELFFKGEVITSMRLKSILTSQNPEIKKLLQLFDDYNSISRSRALRTLIAISTLRRNSPTGTFGRFRAAEMVSSTCLWNASTTSRD